MRERALLGCLSAVFNRSEVCCHRGRSFSRVQRCSLGVLTLFLTLYASAVAANGGILDGVGFLHLSHRGGAEETPENTLAAFQNALAHGANYIECDIRKTADDVVVCHHDPTVNRTTDGTGRVSEMTLAELKTLDAGSWFAPEFAGERIPTLEEALLLVNGQAAIMIDPKYTDWAEDAAAAHANTGLPASAIAVWADNSFWVDDFHILVPGATVIIRHHHRTTPESIIAWFEDPHGSAIASAVSMQWDLSTNLEVLEEVIHLIHTQGIPVFGPVINAQSQWDHARDLGMDGIMTQYPSLLEGYFEEEFECANGSDDDLDTAIDYPSDPECDSARDVSEQAVCNDGFDNDRDGFADFPDDMGCSSEADTTETNPSNPCDDGVDNDGDYWSDLWDEGCTQTSGKSEAVPEPTSELAALAVLACLGWICRQTAGVQETPRSASIFSGRFSYTSKGVY